jgi:hypothetical protein
MGVTLPSLADREREGAQPVGAPTGNRARLDAVNHARIGQLVEEPRAPMTGRRWVRFPSIPAGQVCCGCPSHPATTDGRPGGESSSSSRFLLVFGAVKRESIE